ncbi:hypothetical protein Lser_V15G34766 [Lactuca serriola]
MMQTNGFVFSSIHHGSNHHDSQTTTNGTSLHYFPATSTGTLCKVADSSGDMRKALGIRRGAIERLETELRESTSTSNLSSMFVGSV